MVSVPPVTTCFYIPFPTFACFGALFLVFGFCCFPGWVKHFCTKLVRLHSGRKKRHGLLVFKENGKYGILPYTDRNKPLKLCFKRVWFPVVSFQCGLEEGAWMLQLDIHLNLFSAVDRCQLEPHPLTSLGIILVMTVSSVRGDVRVTQN